MEHERGLNPQTRRDWQIEQVGGWVVFHTNCLSIVVFQTVRMQIGGIPEHSCDLSTTFLGPFWGLECRHVLKVLLAGRQAASRFFSRLKFQILMVDGSYLSWLVVSTPMKYKVSWDRYSQCMEK
jgi:hypothetical protein